jgi:hypothetical protein
MGVKDENIQPKNKSDISGDRKRLLLIACRVLWREFNYYSAQSPHDVNITYIEQGLHNTPDRLRTTLQEQIDRTSDGRFDAILLGYGLCSNGIVGLRARSIPLVVPRAHDCITLLLGSKERYREYFDKHPGTYWYSPGWIDCSDMPGPDRIEKTFRAYCEKYGEENARYLIERTEDWYKKYDNVAYVDWGFGDTMRFKEVALHCARSLGWNYDELRGEPGLVRRFLEGRWDKEDFLVVAPGEEIAGDYNSPTIIRLKC